MASKVVSLYIQDTEISLMVSTGSKISTWARLVLEPGLVSEGVVLDQAALADQIKVLFANTKTKVKKTIIGLSGINTLYRIISIPRLPENLIDEAVTNEIRRILPISLDQVYLSYQVLTSLGEVTKLFVATIPRKTIDTVIPVLRKIGATPYIIDVAPLALFRVLAEPSAIIINGRVSYITISVVVDGVPHIVRTQLVPVELESSEERMKNILEELDRTIEFYNSEHPENPLSSSIPIFVSGEPTHSPEGRQSMADKLGSRVTVLSSPFEAPEGFIPDDYMVNIGLALKGLPLGKAEAGLCSVDLNLLPRESQPPRTQMHRIVLPVALILAVVLVAVLALRLHNTIDRNDTLASQLANLEARISEQEQEPARLREAINNLPRIEPIQGKTDMLNSLSDNFDRTRVQIDEDLVVIAGLMHSVELHNISHASGSARLSGSAENREKIFEYARALRESSRFSMVHIPSISQNLAEVKAMEAALDRIQQAMDALMEKAEIDEVDSQDDWTNDLTDLPTSDDEEITIMVDDDDDPETARVEKELTLVDYLGTATTEYYYKWDEDGQVTQREEKVMTLDFVITLRIR
ncbi:pilus assembly protein PilM [Chloroflexota bacterium]